MILKQELMKNVARGILATLATFGLAACALLLVMMSGKAQAQQVPGHIVPPPVPWKIKSHVMPGVSCNERRVDGLPDFFTFNTTFLPHMRIEMIESCAKALQKKPWVLVEPANVVYDHFREARTENMYCQVSGIKHGNFLLEVRFSSLALTGKGKELAACMELAQNAIDKAQPH